MNNLTTNGHFPETCPTCSRAHTLEAALVSIERAAPACECEHDNEYCCAVAGEFCALCWAHVALRSEDTSRASLAAVEGDAAEVIRQFLRDHALSPRAPLLVDGEAVCVCVICQSAREVMQPVFAKERAELDRVLAEAEVEDPVGVRLTELQLAAVSSPLPAEPPPPNLLEKAIAQTRDCERCAPLIADALKETP